MWRRALGVVSVLAAVGCGGGAAVEQPDLMVEPDLAQLPPDLAGYPAGPYSGEVDGIPENFTLQGFFSPTRTTGLASAEPFGDLTFDQVRRSGARYALVFTAGFT
jgi:hypothetical protein